MALKNLEFNETGGKKFKVSFSTSGKINVFLDRVVTLTCDLLVPEGI